VDDVSDESEEAIIVSARRSAPQSGRGATVLDRTEVDENFGVFDAREPGQSGALTIRCSVTAPPA
jgi:hypothetical protein